MSEPINDGGPAFPHLGQNEAGMTILEGSEGMTLRDYFMAHSAVTWECALNTFRQNEGKYPSVEELAEYLADIRLTEANAMLKARKD